MANERAALAMKWNEKDPTVAVRLAQSAVLMSQNPTTTGIFDDVYSNNQFYITSIANPSPIRALDEDTSRGEFISGGDDSTLCLRTITGKLKIKIKLPDRINSLKFSPSGDTIAAALDNSKILVFNRNLHILNTLIGHTGSVLKICFSHDGKYLLSGAMDKKICIWANNGNCLKTILAHNSNVVALAFSSNDKFFLSGSYDSTAILWDMSGKKMHVFYAPDMVLCVNFMSDEKKIIASVGNVIFLNNLTYQNGFMIWDRSGRLNKQITLPTSCPNEFKFIDETHIVATFGTMGLFDVDNTIRIIDLLTSKIDVTFKGHVSSVKDIVVDKKNDLLISSSWDGTIKTWHFTGKLKRKVNVLLNHMVWSYDEEYLCGTMKDTLLILNKDLKLLYKKSFNENTECIFCSPTANYLVLGFPENVKVISITNPSEIYDIQFKDQLVIGTVFGNKGKEIIVNILDSNEKARTIKWAFKDNMIRNLSLNTEFSYHGLCTFNKKNMFLYKGKKNKYVHLVNEYNNDIELKNLPENVLSMKISKDDKFIALALNDNNIFIYDNQFNLIGKFPAADGYIASFEFSNNNKYLATFGASDVFRGDGYLRIWSPNGTEVCHFQTNSSVSDLLFSPDNCYILTTEFGRLLHVWYTPEEMLHRQVASPEIESLVDKGN